MNPVLGLFVFMRACGQPQQSTETLAESIRSFNEGVRWERFEMAAVAIPPRERSQFVEAMDERADDLKITDYEVVKVDRKGEKEAKVQLKISWYLDSQGTLHETHATQTWQRKGKAWLMVEEIRHRGDEMPGLAERLRDDDEPREDAARTP